MTSQVLLDWCVQNGVYIDPRIYISCDESRGIHVLSKDAFIPPGDTLVRIPKDAVLSVKSCFLSEHIPFELHGLGAQLGLTFALYSEILLGMGSSRWSGYLQSLPSVDLPIFWGCGPPTRRNGTLPILDPSDADLLMWLRGTEVMKRLSERDEANQTVLDNIDRYYHEVVLPVLWLSDVRRVLSGEPDLTDFREAFSLVSSRAFLLDAYHGLAMTPVADAFNHTFDNHVHIQSEFYVCPECGSLGECEHDSDDHDKTRSTQLKNGDYDLYYEMVSTVKIPPREEIFNIYGERLSNADLLMQFGFILDPNDNDLLNFDVNEIFCSLSLSTETWDLPAPNHEQFASLADLFNPSSLVFFHAPSKSEAQFCINSDGKISHQMWVFLVRFLCRNTPLVGSSVWPHVDQFRELIATQIDMEDIQQDDQSYAPEDGSDELDLVKAGVLVEVARTIVRLCETRRGFIGHPAYTGRDLGELLDAIPDDRRRFRLALSVLMSERSILDSCRSNWLDFALTLRVDAASGMDADKVVT